MKKILYFLFFLGFLTSNQSCKTEDESNLYIGCYRIFDQQIPHPYFYKVQPNQLTYINNVGNIVAIASLDSALKSEDTVTIKNHSFYFKHVTDSVINSFDLNDSSKYMFDNKLIYKNFARFRKIKNHSLDLNVIHELIKNKSWYRELDSSEYNTPNKDLSISETWSFSIDSVYFKTKYNYNNQTILSETNALSYQLFQLEGNVFLSLIGSSNNPLPIYQVAKSEKGMLNLIDFNASYVKMIQLESLVNKIDSNKTHYFSKCFEGFQGEYYFGNEVTYIHGNDSIINRFNKNFPTTEKMQGYVIVHFNINCHQQVGDFGLLQMDFAFQTTRFSTETIAYLIREIKKLKDWPVTQSSYEWLDYKDVHGFLMFKIKANQIIDVSP